MGFWDVDFVQCDELWVFQQWCLFFGDFVGVQFGEDDVKVGDWVVVWFECGVVENVQQGGVVFYMVEEFEFEIVFFVGVFDEVGYVGDGVLEVFYLDYIQVWVQCCEWVVCDFGVCGGDCIDQV